MGSDSGCMTTPSRPSRELPPAAAVEARRRASGRTRRVSQGLVAGAVVASLGVTAYVVTSSSTAATGSATGTTTGSATGSTSTGSSASTQQRAPLTPGSSGTVSHAQSSGS